MVLFYVLNLCSSIHGVHTPKTNISPEKCPVGRLCSFWNDPLFTGTCQFSGVYHVVSSKFKRNKHLPWSSLFELWWIITVWTCKRTFMRLLNVKRIQKGGSQTVLVPKECSIWMKSLFHIFPIFIISHVYQTSITLWHNIYVFFVIWLLRGLTSLYIASHSDLHKWVVIKTLHTDCNDAWGIPGDLQDQSSRRIEHTLMPTALDMFNAFRHLCLRQILNEKMTLYVYIYYIYVSRICLM